MGINGQNWAESAISTELADELDPLSLRILHLELTTSNLSSKEIIERLGIKANRKTIDARRRNPAYQKRLQSAYVEPIENTLAASIHAIKRLRGLCDSDDPAIVLEASKILVRAGTDAEKLNVLKLAHSGGIPRGEKTEVHVVWPNSGPTFGDPPIEATSVPVQTDTAQALLQQQPEGQSAPEQTREEPKAEREEDDCLLTPGSS